MKKQLFNLKSPIGQLQIKIGLSGKIRILEICDGTDPLLLNENTSVAPGMVLAQRQLEQFFKGELQTFDLPIDFSDYSPFAVKVLQALQRVPCGETVSYGELAALAGHQGAARAIGRVVGANRTPILIPCHRVIGSNGDLVGYSATGGLKTKRWLLDFEQQILKKSSKL